MENTEVLTKQLKLLKELLTTADIKRISEEKSSPNNKIGVFLINTYLKGDVKFIEVGQDILERGLNILNEKINNITNLQIAELNAA